MGRDEGEDPRRPEALHREGNVAAPADHAGDSGDVMDDAPVPSLPGRRFRSARPRRAAFRSRGRGRRERGAAGGFRGRHAGDHRRRRHGRHRGARSVRRLGALAGKTQPPGNPSRLRHRAARACCCAICMPRRSARGQFYPPDPTENRRVHRRQHRHQRQRVAQLSATAPRAAGSRRLRVVLADGRVLRLRPRRSHRFRPRRGPAARRHQEHRRLSAAARHGLDRPVRAARKARSGW